MSIVLKSGLVALVHGVRTYFHASGISAHVSVGWREQGKQSNQGSGGANRVVFIPGDEGRSGRLTQPRQPGDRPILDAAGVLIGTARALRTWERTVVVSIWAVDKTNPRDEELQIEATDTLFEQVVRGVHRAAVVVAEGNHALGLANVEWSDVRTTTTPVESSFGRELLATLTYRHPIFDEIKEIAFPSNALVNRVLNPTTP